MPSNRPLQHLCQPRPYQLERVGPGRLCIWAPAKINLNLIVRPRRDDGFHEIDSIVSRITLYDKLELSSRDDGQITLACAGLDCGPDQDNLALLAARALARKVTGRGAHILLQKNIAAGAGLGGGSSDAAATLRGTNLLWDEPLSDEELAEMALSLGSDVPLFLGAPSVRMTGRGEELQPVAVHPFAAVLAMPDSACATSEVYEAFDQSPEQTAEQLGLGVFSRPTSQWRAKLVNQLRQAAEAVSPALAGFGRELQEHLDPPVCLTGSGSAMFALYDSAEKAEDELSGLPQHLMDRCRVVRSNPW